MTDKATHTPLPCPFCGGEAETDLMQPFRHYRTGEPLSQPAVYCTVCSAQIAHYPGDVDLSRDETMDLALTAWNTRAVNSHHDLIEALRGLLDEIGKSACADTILDSAAAGKAFAAIAEVEGRRG